MQLLITTKKAQGYSHVHKPWCIVPLILASSAYEHANNPRSAIHKFISDCVIAIHFFNAYKLMNSFALKKRKIMHVLLKQPNDRHPTHPPTAPHPHPPPVVILF